MIIFINDMLYAVLQVITDIARRMGAGMAEFIEREVLSVQDYDLYCHYVAGLVGLGLAQVRVPQLVVIFHHLRTTGHSAAA